MVKGISHVNEAVVNFNVGLVYRGNVITGEIIP